MFLTIGLIGAISVFVYYQNISKDGSIKFVDELPLAQLRESSNDQSAGSDNLANHKPLTSVAASETLKVNTQSRFDCKPSLSFIERAQYELFTKPEDIKKNL